MINAGIAILGFDGFQFYDDAAGQWSGITCRINYPVGQSMATAPASVGDVLIEPNGNAWSVTKVEIVDEAKARVRLDLKLYTGVADPNILPNMGGTATGAIITPINGHMAPYWETSYVSLEVGRIAAMLTMQNMSAAWNGVVDLGKIED